MVKLNTIYTRTGDQGTTVLVGGERIAKNEIRVKAYGDVDEANACIGLARVHTEGEVDASLHRIQHDLFDLGADLSTPITDKEENALRIIATQVGRLEKEIDAFNADLAALNSFVLPGGEHAACHLHLARTVTRRAERHAVELAAMHPVNEEAIKYLNRLSDLLFVLSRYVNHQGTGDVLWEPGVNR